MEFVFPGGVETFGEVVKNLKEVRLEVTVKFQSLLDSKFSEVVLPVQAATVAAISRVF